MLKVLHGDRERLARVNRVRKLDQFLPAMTGLTLIGWSLHFSGILGAAHVVPRLTLLPEHLRQQRASGAALAAWEKIGRGERGDAGSLTPNYLRLSQAERARLEKTKTE